MNITYAQETPVPFYKSIFLAGPTPRSSKVASWRPKAIEYFVRNKFDGNIMYPEFAYDQERKWELIRKYSFIPSETGDGNLISYKGQISWEQLNLGICDVIMFWIPRCDELPGFTTNIEFGMHMYSNKVVVGAPENATHMEYIKECCKKIGIPYCFSLETTVNSALKMLEEKYSAKENCRNIEGE